MNKTAKQVLITLASILVVIGLVAVAPISRLVYSIYDSNRTNDIIKQLEAEATAPSTPNKPQVSDFRKQAYVMRQQKPDGNVFDLLVLTSENTYELSHYEQVITETSSYTAKYFHMSGSYSREGNEVTVEPGICALSLNPNNAGFTHLNGQYKTAEEAAGEKTRGEIYDMEYSSRKIALMKDGSFVVGGTSDAAEELGAPEGNRVFTSAVLQGRVTYKTLVVFDDNTYILYSQATNSNNAEQTTGAFFGFSTYEIKDSDHGIAPDESKPEETYDIITGAVGQGFMYANNNGSHMQFDLQTGGQFSQWLATSFNAPSPTFYITESGFTIKIGALKTTVGQWGLYVPAAEDKPVEPENKDIKLEVQSSIEGKPFILTLKADGTLTTGWTNYEQTVKEGKWAVVDGALKLDLDGTGYTSEIVVNADGTASITVNYDQMGEKVYTMPAAAVSALGMKVPAAVQTVTLEVQSSIEGKPFVLILSSDGTLTTGWTNYAQTVKEAKWAAVDGKLVLDLEGTGYTSETIMNDDGTASITINYDRMGEKTFTVPAEVVADFVGEAPAPETVTLEVQSSIEGKPFVLVLNIDGTLTTGWTNYAQTVKEAKWAAVDGKLVLDLEGTGYTAETIMNDDGTASITINYDRMGEKTFTVPANIIKAYVTATPAPEAVTLEVQSSVEGKPFVLTLNPDGSVLTGWTNYAQAMKEGTWSAFGDQLIITVDGYGFSFEKQEDGSLVINADYDRMGEKTYTMTAKQLAAVMAYAPAGDIKLELGTSVEGKPFILHLRADGTLTTGWTNYAQTVVDGSWKSVAGKLVLKAGAYTFEVVTKEDGSHVIAANYGQMGSKEYAISESQLSALMAQGAVELKLELASSAEGKPFILNLNADGSVVTGWTNYAQTMKEGSWKLENGKLVIAVEGYSFDVIVNEDGSAQIHANYDQMGSKVYTVSAQQFAGFAG